MGLGHRFVALSLPIGIPTFLMTRALGKLSTVYSGLVAGFCGVAGCSVMTSAIITCRTLFSTYLATEMMAFWAMASALCTYSSLYSISCLVLFPTSLLVRLIIAEVS